MTRRITRVVAVIGCLAAVAAVGAVAAIGSSKDAAPNSTEPPQVLLDKQQAAVSSGESEAPSGDEASVTGVIGDDGKFIQCQGKDLLVEERGAEGPVAFVDGARDEAVPMPGGLQPDTEVDPASYAPRCGEDGQATWKRLG